MQKTYRKCDREFLPKFCCNVVFALPVTHCGEEDYEDRDGEAGLIQEYFFNDNSENILLKELSTIFQMNLYLKSFMPYRFTTVNSLNFKK